MLTLLPSAVAAQPSAERTLQDMREAFRKNDQRTLRDGSCHACRAT